MCYYSLGIQKAPLTTSPGYSDPHIVRYIPNFHTASPAAKLIKPSVVSSRWWTPPKPPLCMHQSQTSDTLKQSSNGRSSVKLWYCNHKILFFVHIISLIRAWQSHSRDKLLCQRHKHKQWGPSLSLCVFMHIHFGNLAHLQKVVWHKHFIDRLENASNQTLELEVENWSTFQDLCVVDCIPNNNFEHTNSCYLKHVWCQYTYKPVEVLVGSTAALPDIANANNVWYTCRTLPMKLTNYRNLSGYTVFSRVSTLGRLKLVAKQVGVGTYTDKPLYV